MSSFNKVILMGNLTRDPELRHTASGSPVCSFGIAINKKFKQGEEQKEEVCFVDISVWGSNGENCAKYLKKGSLCMLDGELKFETWEAEGGKRSKLSVTARSVQFLGSKEGAESGQVSDKDVPF
jgi:single-strand DNA-binding protein